MAGPVTQIPKSGPSTGVSVAFLPKEWVGYLALLFS